MTPIDFPTPPKRILIIKPSAIGDVVHTLPILNLIRKRFPSAHIAWLVTPGCAGLLEGHPQLDEIIRFDRRAYATGYRSLRALLGLFRFQKSLRDRNFDVVIDLQGLFRSGWLSWQTGAPVRLGFANAREGATLFYTHRVPIDTLEQHAIERYLTLAQALGCARGPIEYQFPVTESDRQRIGARVPERYAVLLPSANWETKRWPPERFAALARLLKEQTGLVSVVAGGDDAVESAKLLQPAGVISLAGQTSLPELVALLEHASLVIANDTGPMHIAAALGRPLVTPFGPTNPVRTGPHRRIKSVIRLDIACSPCYARCCSHQSCLKGLSEHQVLLTALREINIVSNT